ncbi:MAG: (d)CMP kinase [Prevotella sp.]|nr:(d)CMP kinase [Prevotella sp.]MBR4522203.1 (d)CMP kinase [Prevotella sp.]
MKKITIAIDGHSSCGKSTMAKDLAKEVGYVYVDTGAMYRTVTLYCMQNNLIKDGKIDEEGLRKVISDIKIDLRNLDPQIRSIEVSNNVSLVAAIPFVREEMVERQRLMGKDKGVVMDGRDIGTTVFPDAELKVFVTASAEVRAKRRYDELQAKGMPADYEDILKNVQERDYIDSHREVSPLRQAPDAILLDNSQMTIPEQKEWLMTQFRKAAE